MNRIFNVDNSWTLFLDRDGVLNKRLIDDYVKKPEEFLWEDGVLESLKFFATTFGRIVVVTNQQGVGKGLMTEKELLSIHGKMINDVENSGGRIDKVYFAPNKAEDKSIFRKPNIGMALKARKDFPEIKFKKAVMVGDTFNDMVFGKKLGMINVLISNHNESIIMHYGLVDLHFENLISFAKYLKG
jgi:histidinol-phosphate phosphatase family protein